MKNKNKAFTLVEIVLAMAIIGVVAVLTITNATKDSDEATKVAQLRSTYNILNTALSKAIEENGPMGGGNNWFGTTSHHKIFDYLKLSKACFYMTETESDGCFKEEAQKGNHTTFVDGSSINSAIRADKAILSNGASIYITLGSNYGADVLVDVNGPNKGNNRYGDDIFGFYIDQNEISPLGMNAPFSTTTDGCPYYGDVCTAWVIKMGNMEYFKCPEKLSWTEVGKSTCNQ